MPKHRRSMMERLIEFQLIGCRVDEVGATNNFRNPLLDVIKNNCQLIRDELVASADDKVAEAFAHFPGSFPQMSIDMGDLVALDPVP